MPRRVVVTGGPGSGKSTLLGHLARRGYTCMPESGRAIIREQVANGGTCLPWADRQAYAERMFAADVRSYEAAARASETVFYDRGIVDIVGYLRVEGIAVPEQIDTAAREWRYHDTVVIAPFWPAIYHRDAQRTQNPQVAQRTCEVMREVYRQYGYDVVELPCTDVESRGGFIGSVLRSL